MNEAMSFNGVNGTTGGPISLPRRMDEAQLALLVDLHQTDPSRGKEQRAALLARKRRDEGGVPGLAPGPRAKDLAETGWGVVFSEDESPAVIEALRPLLDRRASQARAKGADKYYRECVHRKGESKEGFLSRNGAQVGAMADPETLPYYLLIVGGPDRVPFPFQTELDVEYAVGRVDFPRPEDYAAYAQRVVDWEAGGATLPRRAGLFATQAPNDVPTQSSATKLLPALRAQLEAKAPDWSFVGPAPGKATKDQLARMFQEERPSFLFAAAHGMAFSPDDPRQAQCQGALLCDNWPGPLKHKGRIPESFSFAGRDLPSDARLDGTIAFFFACCGAGAPDIDDYPHLCRLGAERTIGPRPFSAALPKAMLLRGALAVVGHVERAWSGSFLDKKGGPNVGHFRRFVTSLMKGLPVGAAMEPFNHRYAALAAELSVSGGTRRSQLGLKLNEDDSLALALLWTGVNDARSYVVLGDPAVRLSLEEAFPGVAAAGPR